MGFEKFEELKQLVGKFLELLEDRSDSSIWEGRFAKGCQTLTNALVEEVPEQKKEIYSVEKVLDEEIPRIKDFEVKEVSLVEDAPYGHELWPVHKKENVMKDSQKSRSAMNKKDLEKHLYQSWKTTRSMLNQFGLELKEGMTPKYIHLSELKDNMLKWEKEANSIEEILDEEEEGGSEEEIHEENKEQNRIIPKFVFDRLEEIEGEFNLMTEGLNEKADTSSVIIDTVEVYLRKMGFNRTVKARISSVDIEWREISADRWCLKLSGFRSESGKQFVEDGVEVLMGSRELRIKVAGGIVALLDAVMENIRKHSRETL